jgi:eukaryotic-like serine/threonine-protein kinase
MFMGVTNLPPDPLAGTRYRFVRILGCGGSSDVFEASGPSGERFAIKVLRETFRDVQQYATRFLQEGRILAAIDHPHIVPLREIGMTHDGRPFLAMPRMTGQTLFDYLEQRGPLDPNTAAMLLAGALDGLQEAHRRGIVHRDVKPGNIFIRTKDDGTPERALMFDFGIAKITGAAAHRTTGNRMLGTPRYVSPEQIIGGRIDGRIDVYAMGIVLFEAIAARGPYDLLRSAEYNTVMRAHLSLAPRRLDDLSPASPALARVIERALEKAPGKRFSSAADFAAALRRAGRSSSRRESEVVAEGGLSC